ESYLQCQNIYCSATFKTHESICAVIRSPVTEEKPAPASTAPAVVRKVKGCYSSPFNH
ncbi:ogr/Delta-like zinc finger family protein, partial [Escherichia coli]